LPEQAEDPDAFNDDGAVTRKASLKNRIELLNPIIEAAAAGVEKKISLCGTALP